jgi:hypothetical protein
MCKAEDDEDECDEYDNDDENKAGGGIVFLRRSLRS